MSTHEEGYTFTFGVDGHMVGSQAFLDTTEGFVEALRLIGYRTNSLIEIEYYIEGIPEGSVKVKVKGVYRWSNDFVQNNILGIILIGVLVN